jgi:diaminohydroxyphosphoribosylaminopyrimidine deaminase/5-amino-6-(5-phosphoribosylamino)uracil reductase
MYYFCRVNIHEKYIIRCIELAKNGIGITYPNPMVGSVVVLDDKIIGEGWHKRAGEAHAEVNAIHSVGDKSQLKKATIYINLEPCSHYGKTPPCCNLIVESGIKKVVIGVLDSNSKVKDKGIAFLENAGCEVIVGVLEPECVELNKRFFRFHRNKRPYVVLKWAQTQDGFIDKVRDKNDEKSPNWISNQYSQQLAHKLRAQEQSILVGTTTALNDNPKLGVRTWEGSDPIRIVLDRSLKIPEYYNLYDLSQETMLITETDDYINNRENLRFEKIDFNKNVPEQICKVLFKNQIQSVIVEGGRQTIQGFIHAGLWDEAQVFLGSAVFGKGLQAPE